MVDDERSANSLYLPGNRDSSFVKKPTFSFSPVGATLEPMAVIPVLSNVTPAPIDNRTTTMPWTINDYGQWKKEGVLNLIQ